MENDDPKFNYRDSIEVFLGLSEMDKSLTLAVNAHKYNPANGVEHLNERIEEALDFLAQKGL
jgi:hypothetical protein